MPGAASECIIQSGCARISIDFLAPRLDVGSGVGTELSHQTEAVELPFGIPKWKLIRKYVEVGIGVGALQAHVMCRIFG
jgi:hypothetical protein